MNLISNILGKILPHHQVAAASPMQNTSVGVPDSIAATQAQPQDETVDVVQVLEEMAANGSQNLKWRSSIVDLMKLLGMDSSLTNRKELAKELNYDGDMNDSAAMNIWLQKQVMQKLSENGGKVPSELLH